MKTKYNDSISQGGDTYTNRYSPSRKHNRGSKKFKVIKKKCSRCGSTKNIDLHHLDGNRDNNNRSNLRPMCRSCHRSKHDGKGTVESIFSATARIIDDPQTNASNDIAVAHQNHDLMHVEFILCHNDINANKDYFSSEDMKANASTAVHKPVNWEHSTKNIGVIYESKFISVAELNSKPEEKEYYGKVDPLEKDFIVCKAAVWEYKHPDEARIMRDRNDNGDLCFSMENYFGSAKCSECKEAYSSVYQYCDHLLTRTSRESKAYREFVNSNYIGAGCVTGPADRGAKTLALASQNKSPLVYQFASFIDPEDYISYLAWGGKMRENIELDDKYKIEGEIDKQFFADDINGHFPIDTAENIELTAKVLISEPEAVETYEDSEVIYMLERTAQAAKDYELDISYIVKGEANIMNKDITESPEFRAELEKAKANLIKDQKNGNELQELQASVKANEKAVADMDAKLKAKDQEAAQAKQDLEDYKATAKAHEKAQARVVKLEEDGFEFSEAKRSIVFSCAAALDETKYATFVGLLTEVKDNAVAALHNKEEDKKRKEEEEKKKKKKGKNIVDASQDEADKVSTASMNSEANDDTFEGRLDNVFGTLEQLYKGKGV